MLGNTGHEKYQYMKLYMIMAFSSIYIIPLGTFSVLLRNQILPDLAHYMHLDTFSFNYYGHFTWHSKISTMQMFQFISVYKLKCFMVFPTPCIDHTDDHDSPQRPRINSTLSTTDRCMCLIKGLECSQWHSNIGF